MERKPKELLLIDPPSELRFCGPFTRPVVTIMKLTNTTDQVILFKIKTTAPKRYCVRPNFGTVNPGSFTKVEICLQPFIYDANEKNKHKFMVQSLVAPEDCTDYNKLWKEVEPDQLMDAKLKCVFEMPPPLSNSDASGPTYPEAPLNTNPEKFSPKEMEDKALNYQGLNPSDVVAGELKQLREDISNLRKENINLKEQVVRLRMAQSKPSIDEPFAPMMAEKQIPMFYIAISIAAAIFGLLLGKYLL